MPLFFAMPPWCDVTLYQMAARNVLKGGAHYRDIFDTNLPGFVWAMAAFQTHFGLNYTLLRALDLVIVGAAAGVLCGFVRRGGGDAPAVAWMAVAAALFYPFSSEFNHIQRDPWMLLPAALAARLRLRRVCGVALALQPAPVSGLGPPNQNSSVTPASPVGYSTPKLIDSNGLSPDRG
ncbi:MAG: hypothetical protein ACKODX_11510, partial [Gemmata sp.]